MKVTQSCPTPWTIQSVEFSRAEHWSGWPFPSPGGLPNPGMEPRSPASQADSLPAEPPGKASDSGLPCPSPIYPYPSIYIYTHTHTYIYIHTMEYYSDMKKDEIMLFSTTWADLEITLRRTVIHKISASCSSEPGRHHGKKAMICCV